MYASTDAIDPLNRGSIRNARPGHVQIRLVGEGGLSSTLILTPLETRLLSGILDEWHNIPPSDREEYVASMRMSDFSERVRAEVEAETHDE